MIKNKIEQIIIKTILFLYISFAAHAGGPLGIDHQLTRSDKGIWSRNNQLFLEYSSAIIVLGESLWLGSDTRLGKTFWKSTDSMIMTAVGAAATKEVFRRERPNKANDPDACLNHQVIEVFQVAKLLTSQPLSHRLLLSIKTIIHSFGV